jgi:hypothetical protein
MQIVKKYQPERSAPHDNDLLHCLIKSDRAELM